MKRSASATPSQTSQESDFKPSTPPSKKVKTNSSTGSAKSAKSSSTPKTPGKSPSKGPQNNGTWTAEKKGVFMDEIIAAGYKGADLDALAAKLELSKRQLVDQLVPKRSNLRFKAVKGARGE